MRIDNAKENRAAMKQRTYAALANISGAAALIATILFASLLLQGCFALQLAAALIDGAPRANDQAQQWRTEDQVRQAMRDSRNDAQQYWYQQQTLSPPRPQQPAPRYCRAANNVVYAC